MRPHPSLTLLCCLLASAFAHAAAPAEVPMKGDAAQEMLVYTGTYTGPKSKGIYLFRLQGAGSAEPLLVPMGVAAETPSPSFLEVDARRRLVFSVNEVNTLNGQRSGGVTSFAIDTKTGKLMQLSQQPSMGTGPCHLVLDKTGKNILVANYNSGSVAVLPVDAEGKLGAPTATIQHAGKGAHPQRQAGPHAHCVTLDAANAFAFVCDLGLDQILAYRFDATKGTLTPAETPFTATKPGAGPRHLVFRPDGKFAYVINELNSTVTVYRYDAAKGTLTDLQSESTLPPDFQGNSSCAEITVHPSGKWLYASNRGHDSVATFSIDASSGKIAFVDAPKTGGRTPRHFALTPDGKNLVLENQNSDTLQLARLDATTGKFAPLGAAIEQPSPVCVVFVPPAK